MTSPSKLNQKCKVSSNSRFTEEVECEQCVQRKLTADSTVGTQTDVINHTKNNAETQTFEVSLRTQSNRRLVMLF